MSELRDATIKVLLTVQVSEADPDVIENIRDGLAGSDRRWNDRGEFAALNDEFTGWILDRLAPDWNDMESWYDEEWSLSVNFEIQEESQA